MTPRPFTAPPPPLAGPYRAQIGAGPTTISPAVNNLVAAQVGALLSSSAAWHELSPAARAEMRGNLEKISAYTAALVQEDFALSERLGQTPVLRQAAPAPGPQGAGAGQQLATATEAPYAQAAAGPPTRQPTVIKRVTERTITERPPVPQDAFDTRAANKVASITKETLGAIAFPTFVADLIKGTFNAIVDASIKQMEAFGTLLANVAKTVDQYMADNITDNQARDWLAATYPQHFKVGIGGDQGGGRGRGRAARPSRGRPGRGGGSGGGDDSPATLQLRPGSEDRTPPNFQQDLGLTGRVQLDDKSVEEVLVPAARRRLAQQRHQLLSTMVLMGINRIVVTSGRIYAKMGFSIEATDTGAAESASQFDFKNDTIAGGGFLGFGMVSRNSVAYVSSTKRNSSDEINVQADLTGEVDLKFKSETFPLERFANTGAIAQIQGNTANPVANTPQSSIGAQPGAAPAPVGAPTPAAP